MGGHLFPKITDPQDRQARWSHRPNGTTKKADRDNGRQGVVIPAPKGLSKQPDDALMAPSRGSVGTSSNLASFLENSSITMTERGGWGGIRTHETLSRLPVFKTGAFNRSATHPGRFSSPRPAAASTRLPGPPPAGLGDDIGCRLAARKNRCLWARSQGSRRKDARFLTAKTGSAFDPTTKTGDEK